jgi:hypothetical protein
MTIISGVRVILMENTPITLSDQNSLSMIQMEKQ